MKIKLCEVVIEIETLHDQTYEMCREYEYVGAEAPAFRVHTTQEDIDFERNVSTHIDKAEGREPYNYKDSYLETLAVLRELARNMAAFNTVLLHGSAIAIDGQGYIFTARSGVGKSTFSRNLRTILGDCIEMVNDDKPMISCRNGDIKVYGTPWDGKHHLSSNICVPLRALYFIERSDEPWIKEVGSSDVFKDILKQVYKPEKMEQMLQVMDTLDGISKHVTFYRMGITLDTRTAELFVKTMIDQ